MSPGRFKVMVEGKEDREVFDALAGLLNPTPGREHTDRDSRGKEIRGFEHLRRVLRVQLMARDFDRLAVVIDADEHPDRRWQSLNGVFTSAGYGPLPPEPDPNGTIITEQEERPRIGIWLMPDNKSPGMLEDFVLGLVRAGDLLLDQAIHCIDEIPPAQRAFAPAHHKKAIVHTWLAWQEEPGSSQALAFRRRYLDVTHPQCSLFLDWLQRLLA